MAKMGAPTKLTPELIERAESYVMGGFADEGDLVPSIAGLAVFLGISKNSVYTYGEQDSDFLNTLKQIEVKQEKILINGGLGGTFNNTITKLMLSNHGYSDKVQSDVTTNGETINKPTVIQLVGLTNDDSTSTDHS